MLDGFVVREHLEEVKKLVLSGERIRYWGVPVDGEEGGKKVVLMVRCDACWKWNDDEGYEVENEIECAGCGGELKGVRDLVGEGEHK